MIIKGMFPFLKEKNHVISIVGAGGKTTLMYALAEYFSENGARTIVTTTTHIYQPEGKLWAHSPEEVRALWREGTYAVVGRLEEAKRPEESRKPEGFDEQKKLTALPKEELVMYVRMADIVLIEADGAKRKPCKVPAGHEPVIPKACDIVIGVMGMKALGKTLSESCFRQEKAVRLFGAAPEGIITADMMAAILVSEEGTRKNVGKRDYYVVLNQCDSEADIRAGEKITGLLEAKGIGHCVMTSFKGEFDERKDSIL